MIVKQSYPSKQTKELFDAVLKINNVKEAENFFRDLLTIKEISDFTIRYQIAKDLYMKKGSYQQIAKKYKISTTTVTRVAHWLKYGTGGYRLILKRLYK